METDILIIGQGICGSFLAWWLEQAGLSFIVIDEARPFSASRVAAGLINPVTGRRIVKTWMIDELLPFANQAYRQMGDALGLSFIKPARVLDFFPTAQMRVAFLERYSEHAEYLQLPNDEHDQDDLFRYDLGYGMIGPCYLVDMPGLLDANRKRIQTSGRLIEERFDHNELILDPPVLPGEAAGIRYKDIRARRIIFCDGIESSASPYFSRLPFALNKGEALIVEIPGLAEAARDLSGGKGPERVVPEGVTPQGMAGAVFKKGISLVPWKDGLYWAGSSFEWSFSDDAPTEIFRERTQAILKDWLKTPFNIVDHFASVRPATLERRPFVGSHPLYPAVGILNGMGTKGCSLVPFFAYELVQYILKGTPIRPDVDVTRFSKVLSRK